VAVIVGVAVVVPENIVAVIRGVRVRVAFEGEAVGEVEVRLAVKVGVLVCAGPTGAVMSLWLQAVKTNGTVTSRQKVFRYPMSLSRKEA
jgi:hypothetical protein